MSFVERNGFQWPAEDKYCCDAVFSEGALSLERVYERVTNWDAVIQAGGNCGVWPWMMASKFGAVYTFEPDRDNFTCLARNACQPNVFPFRAALGAGNERPTDMLRNPENCGAYQLQGAGQIPVITIDSLRLPSVGLIYLDIEGFEPFAIAGALHTIRRCKPIIALEVKGLEERYGVDPKELPKVLTTLCNYAEVDRFGRDVVYAPC